MGSEGEKLKVMVRKTEGVRAALPMQEHWLPLSNLDLLLPAVDVGVLFCYNSPISTCSFASMVAVLKTSLSQALVSFYAFGGEVIPNSIGEPELLCNNRGVDFIEAFADAHLHQLNLYNPDQTIEAKLVPSKKHGVLSVQATELKCGGMVVGCTFDHRIADAYSANMFMVSWARMASADSDHHENALILPCFRRSLLNPRRPLSIHPSIDQMYISVSALMPSQKPTKDDEDDDGVISRIYYVKAHQLEQLQKEGRRSKVECFSAFLWKMVGEWHGCGGGVCKMGIVVDGRQRLGMESYFGNVLSIPFGSKPVEELKQHPLEEVAEEVHQFIQEAVSKDHFLHLIDWVEAHRPVPALAKIYASGSLHGPAFVVSSGLRFPLSQVDFGWGSPAFCSYHFPWKGDAGYVMPLPSPASNGDWLLYMHLSSSLLHFLEKHAPCFFLPFSWSFLL